MTILSIDQSYTSSGVVVLSNDGELLHAELFKTDKESDVFERAWNIANYVGALADDHSARFIALEGLAYAKAGDATRDLAGLQFVLVTVLRYLHDYHVEVVYPTTAKKYGTGKGNSKKEELLKHLPEEVRAKFDELGAKKTTGLLDLTDAYWIGQVALGVVDKDYTSKPINDLTLDDATEKAITTKLEEQTGYPARINPETFAPELYVQDRWIELEIAE